MKHMRGFNFSAKNKEENLRLLSLLSAPKAAEVATQENGLTSGFNAVRGAFATLEWCLPGFEPIVASALGPFPIPAPNRP